MSSMADILISHLSTCEEGIYERIVAYLHLFEKPPKTHQLKRSLVDYYPFLTRAVNTLNTKLIHRSKLNENFAGELFDVYKYCLCCLQVISKITNKPRIVLTERYKIMKCFAAWGRWEDGEGVGLKILKSFKEMQESVVEEGIILAKTVSLLFCFAANKKSHNPNEYERLYEITMKFQHWIRVLDEDLRQRVLTDQAGHLTSCAIFLVGEVSPFDSKCNLASRLCESIITRYTDSVSPHLRRLCDSLYRIGERRHRDKQFNQALDAFKLHCQATWAIIQGKLKETKADLSYYESLEFFDKWCEGSTFLFQVLSQSEGTHEMQKAIKDSLNNWAENLSERLPGPMSVVKQWVEIQIEIIKGRENMDDEGTLLLSTSLSSFSKVSRKKILQQELLSYVQMQTENPEFCGRMQMIIKGILEKDGFGTSIDWLEESTCLRLCGIKGPKYCVQYLSQAIEVSSGHQLAVAYCLRSLCTEEDDPNSEQVFQDIHSALDVWLDMDIPPSDGFMVPENTMKLLYSIIDLLSIKGRVDFHHSIYKVMIMIYTLKNVPLSNLLAKLWESRRIRHALCPSPVLEAFMSLTNDFDGKLKFTEYWIDSLRESQPLVVGFHNNFSFPGGSSNHESSSQSHITVEKVEEVASKLISRVSESSGSGSAYIAGYMYYDLCERLVSNGCFIEALPYAMEAHRLREELFQQKFPWPFERQGEEYSFTGNDVLVRRSVASELWSFDTSSCDLEICYIS